jgi:hypothetical protein
VGAVVTVRAGGRDLVRLVESASGYLAQSSRTLLFGLGDAANVERCTIRWPGGATQTVSSVEVDSLGEVVELPGSR